MKLHFFGSVIDVLGNTSQLYKACRALRQAGVTESQGTFLLIIPAPLFVPILAPDGDLKNRHFEWQIGYSEYKFGVGEH
jgi:hypothetical protein